MKTLGHVAVYSAPDPKIARLSELAYNLWWSWTPEAQALYRDIDPDLWKRGQSQPGEVPAAGQPGPAGLGRCR